MKQVVIIYWEEDFGWSVSSLSQLMAVVHICNGLSTPLSGLLIDKYPSHLCIAGGLAFLATSLCLTAVMTATWQVWIVYGVLCGTSYGLLNLNVFSVAVMRHLPPKKHGLAVGIATSGSTFGQFAIVPVFTLVTRTYGWRTGYLALATFAFVLILPAFLLLRDVQGAQNTGNDSNVVIPIVTHSSDCDRINVGNSDTSSALQSNNVLGSTVYGAILREEKDDIGPQSGERSNSLLVEMVDVHTSTAGTAANTNLPDEKQGSKLGDMQLCLDEEQPFVGEESIGGGNENKLATTTTSPVNNTILIHFLNMWKCPQFTALSIAFFLCGITTTGFIETHLVKVAVHNDFSLLTGSLAFSVLAACNGISMVVTGYLVDYLNRHYILAVIFTVRAAAYVLLLSFSLQSGNVVTLFTFSVIFGSANYSVVPPVISLVQTYLPAAVGLSTGVLLMFHSAGAALGAALGGFCFQQFGGYDEAIGLCVLLCLVAAASCLAMQTCGIGKHEKLFRNRVVD